MKKLCLWIMVVCLVLTTLSASAFAYTELDYSCFEGEWFWSIADNDNVDTRRELASADLRIIQCNGEYLTFEFYGTAYHYLRKVYGTRIGIYDNTAYAENEDGLYVRLYFSESGISFETNMKSGASAALAKSDGFYPRTNEVDYARDINMCVGGYNLRRTIASVNGFDMLPILDVACELGFNVIFNDNEYILTNNIVSYTFKNGEAAVANTTGEWIGLDIVPQYIKGRFMIPAKFFTDVFGYSYVWDSVTDTVFINSAEQYESIISADSSLANPKFYLEALNNMGTIVSYGSEIVQNHIAYNNVKDLYYFIADVNYDGILDLIVSTEKYLSNGILIYTCKDGNLVSICDLGMPYSAGSETLTLATYNGKFGIFRHRQNSTDEFSFRYINSDGTYTSELSGYHYDTDEYKEYKINDSSYTSAQWWEIYHSITPVEYYSYSDLSAAIQ